MSVPKDKATQERIAAELQKLKERIFRPGVAPLQAKDWSSSGDADHTPFLKPPTNISVRFDDTDTDKALLRLTTAETAIIAVRITAAGIDANSLSLLNTRYPNTANAPQQFTQAVCFVAPAQFPGLEAVNSARAWYNTSPVTALRPETRSGY